MKYRSLSFLAILGALALASCDPASGVASSSAATNSSTPSASSLEADSSSQESAASESSSAILPSASSVETESSSSPEAQNSSSASTRADGLPMLEEDAIWNVGGALNALRGPAFRDALASSILKTGSKTCSYSDLWSYFPTSDKAKDGTIRPFYHSPDESATRTACNKEHVWPKSRGAVDGGAGSDPQVIRPALEKENSSRGNNFYGTGSSEFDPGSCGYEGARGEAARIIFYAATRYAKSANFNLTNNPGDATTLHSMGTLKKLIEWNNEYPVNEAETLRNDALQKFGFARNPFIDHPEYANYIWDESGLLSENYAAPESSSSTLGHTLITSSSALESAGSVYVVCQSGDLNFAMSKNAKSEDLPWYLQGVSVEDPSANDLTSSSSDLLWTVSKADGGYRLSADGKNLYSYVSGTHYSLCLDAPTESVSASSDVWSISFASGGAVTMSSAATGVYLEYYNGSWCGYKSAGSIPFYFYSSATHAL